MNPSQLIIPSDLIIRIMGAKRPADLFTNLSDWKKEYLSWLHLIHVDRCKLADAPEAYLKLQRFRDELENGITWNDEHCKLSLKGGNLVIIEGPEAVLKTSYTNYQAIVKSKGVPDHFVRYLPKSMELKDGKLNVELWHRSILMHDLTLEEKHVKWVMNRMLECSAIMNVAAGWTHCGLNPNSVLICPEEHGIQIISFYHSVQSNHPLKSVIGKHPIKTWYPPTIFSTKRASSAIDLSLSKKTGIYLLGDRSGLGTSLRGKIDNGLLNFLLANNNTTIQEAYIAYQTFLDKSPREYHKLNL